MKSADDLVRALEPLMEDVSDGTLSPPAVAAGRVVDLIIAAGWRLLDAPEICWRPNCGRPDKGDGYCAAHSAETVMGGGGSRAHVGARMSARDDLIELINSLQDVGRDRAFMIADALLAAGWRSPLLPLLTCGNGFADGGFAPNPLTALRTEVARLRDSASSDPAFSAYESVLNLIDCKHLWVNSYPGSGSTWRECGLCGMQEIDQ